MTNTELSELIELALLNPSLMQQAVYNGADEIMGGTVNVVNATNPFSYLVEVNCATAAAQAAHHRSLTNLLYPKHAVDEETLYRFMSDKDYDGRFATPGSAPIKIAIRKEEIVARAVPVGDTKVSKIVIPRNTNVRVDGVDFGLHYPIEIRLLPHGGLQLVWNVDKVSPLQTLTSNVVDWTLVSTTAGDYVFISVTLPQFSLTHRTEVLNSATGFVKNYEYTDQYYYCRVYHSSDAVTWTEIETTHSKQVYDPTTMTALLRVESGRLRVEIPQIYFSTGKALANLRVDIYTTKGVIEKDLSGYTATDFVTSWLDYDNDDKGVYVAPLSLIAEYMVTSEGSATGGTDAIDFDTLRSRVISNGLTSDDEVSPAQLQVALEKRGYGVVKNIDQITNRIYLATRSLPNPSKNQIVSGANCCINMFSTKIDDLVTIDTVIDNTGRVTLLPTTLYKFSDGLVQICSNQERRQLLDYAKTNPDALANAINQADYIYSPFHYVLDTTQEFFECRGYLLTTPKIEARRFLSENETAEIDVASAAYDLKKVADGWELYVLTRSGTSYQSLLDSQVWTQLALRPVGESTYAYVNGVLVGTSEQERLWRFDLKTNYDIDYQHSLTLTNLSMFGNDPQNIGVSLDLDVQIFHGVTKDAVPATFEQSGIDAVISDEILTGDVVGVVREQLSLSLGSVLSNLWSNARAVVTEADYVRYTENVPAYWPENMFERDPGTGAILWVTGADGKLEPKQLLHAKGDPKLLADGSPEWAHQVDEIKYVNGKPVIKNERALGRQVDLLFLEGSLYFATDSTDVAYVNGLASEIVTFLERDIGSLSQSLLENTKVYFMPTRTLGQTKAIVKDGLVSWIPSALSWSLNFYLSETQYANSAFKSTLETTAKKVIANALTRNSVSLSQINEEIRAALGGDAVPIDIDPLGPNKDITTFTLYDDSSRCGVRHLLKVLPDETLQLVDDVTCNWIPHSAT